MYQGSLVFFEQMLFLICYSFIYPLALLTLSLLFTRLNDLFIRKLRSKVYLCFSCFVCYFSSYYYNCLIFLEAERNNLLLLLFCYIYRLRYIRKILHAQVLKFLILIQIISNNMQQYLQINIKYCYVTPYLAAKNRKVNVCRHKG